MAEVVPALMTPGDEIAIVTVAPASTLPNRSARVTTTAEAMATPALADTGWLVNEIATEPMVTLNAIDCRDSDPSIAVRVYVPVVSSLRLANVAMPAASVMAVVVLAP